MARAKTPKTVITFATTVDAMAWESAALKYSIPGRIIPVPSAISAGCGLAWCASEEQHDELLDAAKKYALAYEGVHVVELY